MHLTLLWLVYIPHAVTLQIPAAEVYQQSGAEWYDAVKTRVAVCVVARISLRPERHGVQ